eukprot:GFKZ01010359.1.p1 GENE.GFKZ01010359.1~~GFKZ01010359.1.p1  ORF type:complete len:166 (-),score=30.96 GFKZ01010359.1:302-799(-)
MSTWQTFRQHWLKPDIYPLIAIMTGALSLGSISFIHTAHNPSVHWHSASRRYGVDPFQGVEYTPYVARFKNTPSTIFEKNNAIWDTLAQTSHDTVFVVPAVPPEDEAVDVMEEDARVVQRAVAEALGYAAVVVRDVEGDEEGGAEVESDLTRSRGAEEEARQMVV